ncbi:MAG: T9SS type A sorting domain-containing protein [Candidatus Eisenbacteria bacterium]|nr:T9SS type A sorting domain-containing protein [Candidatus Eisenbacteria bacterium]
MVMNNRLGMISALLLSGMLLLATGASADFIVTDGFEDEDLGEVPEQWIEWHSPKWSYTPILGTARVTDDMAFGGVRSLHFSASERSTRIMHWIGGEPVSGPMEHDPYQYERITCSLRVYFPSDTGSNVNFGFSPGMSWFDIAYRWPHNDFYARLSSSDQYHHPATLETDTWYCFRLVLYPQEELMYFYADDEDGLTPIFEGLSFADNFLTPHLVIRCNCADTTSIYIDDIELTGEMDLMNSRAHDEDVSDLSNQGLKLNVHPNPLTQHTDVQFILNHPGSVQARIFDASGRLVRTLIEDRLAAGRRNVVWDGTDARGSAVANGIYFVRVTMDGRIAASRRLTVVR